MVTTGQLQALMLLNDEFARAEAWAARLVRQAGPSPARQIQRGFRLALTRSHRARGVVGPRFPRGRGREAGLSHRQLFRPDVPASLVDMECGQRIFSGTGRGLTYHRGHWSSAREGSDRRPRPRAVWCPLRAAGRRTVDSAVNPARSRRIRRPALPRAGQGWRGSKAKSCGSPAAEDPRRHGKEPILLEKPCPIPTGRLFTVRVEAPASPRLRVWTDRGPS